MSASAATSIGCLVSGDHGSAGKTTVSIGLSRHLRQLGHMVQPFKKGPDFIDPMWLTRAAGRVARNLDFRLMGEGAMRERFARYAQGATVALVEGNKGLFDGVDPEGSDSTSALARLLDLPVALVIDCAKMTRGVAPLVLGYSRFEADLRIAGVILNNVAGPRHEQKLRAALETYTDVRVLGAIPRLKVLEIRERHLGLTPDVETVAAETLISACASAVGQGVDVETLLRRSATVPTASVAASSTSLVVPRTVRIAVARDAAFSFYYPESLEALEAAGAELIAFSPLTDALPACDGVYLGGGFPELFAAQLSANVVLRDGLRAHAARGGAIYAECGGLMLLGQSLEVDGVRHAMAGALEVTTAMMERPQGRGYMALEVTGASPSWQLPAGASVAAHEFHHSRAHWEDATAAFAYRVRRGEGAGGGNDGFLRGGVLASYAHLHPAAAPWWAPAFVDAARRSQTTHLHHPLAEKHES